MLKTAIEQLLMAVAFGSVEHILQLERDSKSREAGDSSVSELKQRVAELTRDMQVHALCIILLCILLCCIIAITGSSAQF
jgi:hypothetical protein